FLIPGGANSGSHFRGCSRQHSVGATEDWYLADHLGSVRGLMNNSGALDDALTFDAFGNVTQETTPANGDRYKWTGRETDSETGLQYNRARYYDPRTGRWISPDPLGPDCGDSNLYRYVHNGYSIGTDPSGLDGVPARVNEKTGEHVIFARQ